MSQQESRVAFSERAPSTRMAACDAVSMDFGDDCDGDCLDRWTRCWLDAEAAAMPEHTGTLLASLLQYSTVQYST